LTAVDAATEASLVNDEKPIPESIAINRYDTVFARNPFLIKIPERPVAIVSFADDWELRGYYSVRGKETAVMFNKKENKTTRVTIDEHKDYGLKLLRAEPAKRRSETKITIGKGTENHTFSYPENPNASAAGGQPGVGNPTVPNNLRAPTRSNVPLPAPSTGTGNASSVGRRVILPNPSANSSPPNRGVDSNNDGIPENVTPGGAPLSPNAIGPGSTPNIPSPISRRRRLLLPPNSTPTPPAQTLQ
jgi:hypothetical protein